MKMEHHAEMHTADYMINEFVAGQFLNHIRKTVPQIELSEVTVSQTPQKNWIVYRNGVRVMIVPEYLIDWDTVLYYNLDLQTEEYKELRQW
jgi:hypothetical protein